jgi:hypothetical protein
MSACITWNCEFNKIYRLRKNRRDLLVTVFWLSTASEKNRMDLLVTVFWLTGKLLTYFSDGE